MDAAEAFWAATLLFAAALIGFLVLGAIDQRELGGVGIWTKPTNFAFATALHFATFAIIVNFLSPASSGSTWLMVIAAVAIAAAVFEVGYIAVQAGRGMSSHFNTATPFYAAMYSLMALGALLVLLPAPFVGSLALIDSGSHLSMAARLAIAIGLIGGTVLTIVTAFRLGGNGGHFVGTEPLDGKRMPLTGWSLSVGDLRPAHFLATHMMQALPIAGLVLGRTFEPVIAISGVLAVSLIWVGLCLAAFLNALEGRALTALWS